MKWSHLPVPGGLYDQHPDLIAQWMVIFAAEDRHRRREEAKRNRSMNQPRVRGGKRV